MVCVLIRKRTPWRVLRRVVINHKSLAFAVKSSPTFKSWLRYQRGCLSLCRRALDLVALASCTRTYWEPVQNRMYYLRHSRSVICHASSTLGTTNTYYCKTDLPFTCGVRFFSSFFLSFLPFFILPSILVMNDS